MRRVLLVTNVEKYLLMRAISRDISNMCVQITLVELGSVHIVVKLFNTHATSNVISDHTLVSFYRLMKYYINFCLPLMEDACFLHDWAIALNHPRFPL